jgi:cysteine desulfurase
MRIYLDHNATTRLRPEVLEAMLPFLQDEYGNASSVHAWGSSARCAVEDARIAIAAALNARPAEITFTSGGTESNNLAIIGGARGSHTPQVFVGATEHSSVLAAAAALPASEHQVTRIPVDGTGLIDIAEFEAMNVPAGSLVSIGWANNEVGSVQPIRRIADSCTRRAALLHVDAAQAFGKIPIHSSGIDMLSLSGHKIGGPKGIGVLFVRDGIGLQPQQVGGSQERSRRAGTENVAAITGMARACSLALAELDRFGEACVAMRDRLWKGLHAALPGVHRHGREDGLPNTLNVRFDDVRGEALVAALDLAGIAVSGGSACAAGAGEPSHVLLAMGLGEVDAGDGVRYSVGRTTRLEEIHAAIAATVAAVERIRAAKRMPRA